MGTSSTERAAGATAAPTPTPTVAAPRKRAASRSASVEVVNSQLQRRGRASSIRGRDDSITPMRGRSNSIRINKLAAAGTMSGEQLMSGLGPGHTAGRLLLQLSDPTCNAQMLLQDLANTAQIGNADDYESQFKAALTEQFASMIGEQKDQIIGKLSSSQMHALRWSLQAAARQQPASAVPARMSLMLEALCTQFGIGDVIMPKSGGDEIDRQLAGIVSKLDDAHRSATGTLNAAALEKSRVSYDVHQDSLARFREGSRKGVCELFRSQCASGNNIYIKGSAKPINSASLRGTGKAGSGDLIKLCTSNACSLATSQTIVALQNPQAASDIFGDELGRRLPLPKIGDRVTDNVTFSSIRQRFDLEKGEAGKVLLRVHTDATLDVAAIRKRGNDEMETKLNPAQSRLNVELLVEINSQGEVRPVRLDYDYAAQPVLGIEVENLSRQAKTVAKRQVQQQAAADPSATAQPPAPTRRKLPKTPGQQQPAQSAERRSMRLPKPVRRFTRSMSFSAAGKQSRPQPAAEAVSARPDGQRSGESPATASVVTPPPAQLPPQPPATASVAAPPPPQLPPQPPAADVVAASKVAAQDDVVATGSEPVAPAPIKPAPAKIDIRQIESAVWIDEDEDLPAEVSNDVLAAVNGALDLANGLIERDENAAAAALRMLASSGVLADALHSQAHRFLIALDSHVTAMDSDQFEQFARAINSPEVVAAEAMLAKPSLFSHNPMIIDKCRHIADMLGKLRRIAGGVGPASVDRVSDSDRQFVRSALEKFAGEMERNTSEIEYEPLGAKVRQRFAQSELGTIAADSRHDYVCKDFLDEAASGSYKILAGEGQPYRWLVNPLGLTGGRQDFRQKTAERLLELCDGRKAQALALSRVLTVETGELIKPAEENLRAVTPDPRLQFSIRTGANDSIEVTVECQDALRQYDPDDDSRLQELNPNFSSWQGKLQLQVAADGTVTPLADSRKAVLVPRGGEVSDFADYRVAAASRSDDWNALSGIDKDFLIEFIAELDTENNRRAEQMAADSGLFRQNLTRLGEDGVLDDTQITSINQRLELMADVQRRMERLISEQVAGADVRAQIAEHVRNAKTDLELLQFDIDEKKNGWARGDMRPDRIHGLNSLLDALKLRMSSLAGNLSWFEEQADALAGRSGDPAGQRSPAARTTAAVLQAEASYAAVTESFAAALDAGVELEDAATDLLSELSGRRRQILSDLRSIRDGKLPSYSYGTGAAEPRLSDAGDQIRLNLKKFKPLPAAHPQLSEGQLVDLRVRHFLDEHPQFRSFFSNFSGCRAAHLAESIGGRDWGTIKREFVDDAASKPRPMVSTITPAARFAEEGFAASYGGVNVAAQGHFTATHAVNLAHTELSSQSDGRSFYSGLRHGIVDNYLLAAESLRDTSRFNLERLHRNILSSDQDWQRWAAANGGGSLAKDLPLLRSEAGSEFAAQLLRPQANLNAAREVIRAAVVSDQALLAAARQGQDVEVTVNAISLVTPGTGSDALPAEQLLENHRAALSAAARQPIPITVFDDQGRETTVSIKAKVRTINCEIGRYGASLPQPPATAQLAQHRADEDQRNLPQIEEMIGALDNEEIGGAAAQRVAELEADAGTADGSAFGTRGQRAGAIRRLVDQIKRLLVSGSHWQNSGGDPYQVPVRLALLSFLLGDKTSVCCESGNARSGNLDARVKQLAAALAAGDDLRADAASDGRQLGKYLLRTGNSEFHNASSGRFGYRLDDALPPASKINDPVAADRQSTP